MRVVNWNIQWALGMDGRADLRRIVADAKKLADFDVLCLQEVSRGFDVPEADGGLPGGLGPDQFAELAELLPGYTVLEAIGSDFPSRRQGGARRQFGNAIATRLPVGQVIRHTLPWPADLGSPSMQRVALEASIGEGAGALRVVTTHLEYYSELQRLAQVEALRGLHVDACRHAAAPPDRKAKGPFGHPRRPASALVCGDFNAAFESAAYLRMLAPVDNAPSFVDAWSIAHPAEPRAPTVGLYDAEQWSDGPFACDFMFVTADLAARVRRCDVDVASASSDHQAMVLELA